MSGWAEVVDGAASNVAMLLATGADVAAESRRNLPGVLAARNALLGELRGVVNAITETRLHAATDLTAADVAEHPAAAFAVALRLLPRVQGAADGLGESGSHGEDVYGRLWHGTARSCIQMEAYIDALGHLPEDAAWKVLRDITDLARAVPALDLDLARIFPPTHPAHPVLTDATSHGVLRLAAHELVAGIDRHLDLRPTDPILARSGTPRLTLPRLVADVRASTDQLAAIVGHRGALITMDEVRAVANLLHDGLGVARDVLTRPLAQRSEWVSAADMARSAQEPLHELRRLRAATLTPTRMDVIRAAGDIRTRLRTLAKLAERVPVTAHRDQWERLTSMTLSWMDASRSLMAGVQSSLGAAVDAGNVMVPCAIPGDPDSAKWGRAWLDGRTGDQVLDPVKKVAAALRYQPSDMAAGASTSAAVRATAGTARHELRAALSTSTRVWAVNGLPPHPRDDALQKVSRSR